MINLKLTLRNLIKGGTHTVLNIVGLAIGFACTFGIAVWIKNEFSYDKHLPDADRIYRLTFETNTSGNRLHFARCNEKWISQLPAEYPQIEELVRLSPYRHTAVKTGTNKFYTDRIFASDSNFFSVFNISLITGNRDNILREPYATVISESLARKCFGDKDPVGQALFLSGEYDEKMIPFTIKGVMKDIPANSHIHIDAVTSFVNPNEAPDWAYVYLLLRKGANPGKLLSSLPDFIEKVEPKSQQRTVVPYLQKISDIHLYSDKDREVEPNGNITVVWLFSITALVILAVCLVNFYNLCKARILNFQKSIFVQRVLGSEYRHIAMQSATESGVIVFLAFILSLMLLDLAGQIATSVPGLNWAGNSSPGFSSIWPVILIILLSSLFTGTLPILVLIINRKLNIRSSRGLSDEHNRLKSYGVLMTLQFALSIILMISTVVIFQQKKHIFSLNLGNMNPNIIVLKKLNWEVRFKYNSIREQVMADPLIKNFTASMEEPAGETVDAMQVESSGLDENHRDKQLYLLSAEDNFLDFFGIRLVTGRNFSKFNPDRKGEDYILNEAAVKELGWTPQDAIGKPFKIRFDSPDIFYGGTVVGVAKDFNIATVKQKIKPYVIFQKPIFYLCFLIELDPSHKKEAIESLKKIWERELPDYPFQYEFIGDLYSSVYRKELNESKLALIFSILIIFIICMGLFAITSVLIERRTREIGIRKVNGARVVDILRMLSSDFFKWYLIAFIIACPVAWLLMKKWLQNFTYSTDLRLWMFVIPGLLVFGITFLTLILRSWNAAKRNPVEALRYE